MKYIIYGSLTSPYVRKLRLLMHELAPYELKLINYLEKADNELLQSINPINKIPVLVDGEQIIWDSRVIYNYLSRKHQLKTLTIHEENILSAIDGAMDTSINLFSLRRGGLDLEGANAYVERQKERIPAILKMLSSYAQALSANKADDWNFVSMSLYSYLYWGQYREMLNLSSYSELKKFLEEFKNAPGVQETTPP